MMILVLHAQSLTMYFLPNDKTLPCLFDYLKEILAYSKTKQQTGDVLKHRYSSHFLKLLSQDSLLIPPVHTHLEMAVRMRIRKYWEWAL